MQDTIGKKFKSIRKKLGISQEELGRTLGVSKQAINNVEGEKSNPSILLISKLIVDLNINSNWLIAGKGEMFLKPEFEDVKSEIMKEVEEMLKNKGL